MSEHWKLSNAQTNFCNQQLQITNTKNTPIFQLMAGKLGCPIFTPLP